MKAKVFQEQGEKRKEDRKRKVLLKIIKEMCLSFRKEQNVNMYCFS